MTSSPIFPVNKVYVLVDTGAIGDSVAALTPLKLMADRGHIEKLLVPNHLWSLYSAIFPVDMIVNLQSVMAVIPKEKVTPDIPSHAIDPATGDACYVDYPFNRSLHVIKLNDPNLTPIHATLIDHFTYNLSRCILKEDERDYVPFPRSAMPPNPMVGRKYGVIAYGSTTEHRKMLPEAFLSIRDHLISKGLEVVLLGKTDHKLTVVASTTEITSPSFDGLDDSGCVNLIDKTTLVESISVIAGAEVIIGVDGGLLHLAGMTDTPIVAGFTTVDPYYRPIHRHGIRNWKMEIVEPTSTCKYCQTAGFMSFNINFHKCWTATKECMYSIGRDQWIPAIDKALTNG